MKRMPAIVLAITFSMLSVLCSAQPAPGTQFKLFALYPQQIDFSETVLSSALRRSVGAQVSLNFGAGLIFNGIVISNELKYDNLQTVIIKSAALSNTLLTISRITPKEGAPYFKGRMINKLAYDGYEIKRDVSNYSLQKFVTAKVLPVCSL